MSDDSKIKLRDYQAEAVAAVETSDNQVFLLDHGIGTGKACENNTPILTEFGWKPISKLKIGDKVATIEGNFAPVIGVYPQGFQDCYEITFADGNKSIVSKDHLWYYATIKTKKALDRNKKYWPSLYKLGTTEEMKQNLKSKGKYIHNNIFVPTIRKPIEFKQKNFLIHPYILGVILGDGSIAHKAINITVDDKEIITKIKKLLPEKILITKVNYKNRTPCYNLVRQSNKIQNIFTKELRRLGLMGTKSYDKFVPEEYLFSSVEQRIELLRGLLDTDGTVSNPRGRNRNSTIYYTISPQLRDNVKFLCESLGGICKISIKKPFYKDARGKKIQGQNCYVININLPQEINPFSLTRKKKAVIPKSKYSPKYRAVLSITPIGKRDCTCIKVDHPTETFLIDGCIPTHNTITALSIAKEPIYVLVQGSLVDQWAEEAARLGIELYPYRGDKSKRIKNYQPNYNWVMSYNNFRNDFDFLFKHLKKLGPYTLILDEAQIVKNPKTKTHKCVLKLKRWTHCKILLLSGTIITKPEDSYGICKILNPEAYQNKLDWENQHVAKKDWFGNIEKYKNLDLMKANLYKYAHCVPDDVLGLDKPVITKISYPLLKKHKRLYDKLLEDKVYEIDEDRVLTLNDYIFAEAQQLVVCPESYELPVKSQVPTIIKDIITQVGPHEKIVFFTRYNRHLYFLADKLKALKYHGSMTSEEKEFSKKTFINDLTQKYLVLNIKAGGVGLDGLQKVCKFAVFVDPPLNSPELMQAIGRLRRSGQKYPVRIWLPYAKDTIQESLVERLDNRLSLYDSIVKNQVKKILKIS